MEPTGRGIGARQGREALGPPFSARINICQWRPFRYNSPALPRWWNGRHAGFRSLWGQPRVGSSPILGTMKYVAFRKWRNWLAHQHGVLGVVSSSLIFLTIFVFGHAALAQSVEQRTRNA